MFGFRKRSKNPIPSPQPIKKIVAQHAATCRSCGRTVTEMGTRANFRVVSLDARTGVRWIDACVTCRLRSR